MYNIYVLYNKKHNKIYIGQTKNLKERLRLHKGVFFKKSFTSRFDGEWTLIYKEEVVDRKKALEREKQLKSFRGREFIKTHIPL
ncbi:MAG: GIY-YIG nuclease family protein [Patescibacteria group bacterium]